MINSFSKYFFAFLFVSLNFFNSPCVFAQDKTSIYRATNPKINDLVHTKLNVSFDYGKRHLLGEAWLTLSPHFYPTDSLTLNAKGMDIKEIALLDNNKKTALKFSYDSLLLKIKLNKSYSAKENYIIYIAYTAKPDELKTKGSAAITDAKGLYFINPDSSIAGKPVQIWTQGETEAASVWFPTIDSPNQKSTEEISMTVPAKYVTLSNGYLAHQKDNKNGTRTDTWKMDKPHSPYLFMMAVGDFKIYHDKWKNIPVDYYLEPAYAPFAKSIFGDTPEMIGFYSEKLGIDFPWNKYAQIVVRDYVSGAMENTTATLHGDFVQQTDRELLDGSKGEEVIAHELFHQWFGDYVTAESWSNLSVNESFADFSEMLWDEHKHGKDAGDAHSEEALQAYLNNPTAKEQQLIRFNYDDKEDVFDVVTYQKGGRILNMLRNYLGEDAFFKGLHLYLTNNAYKNGEAQQLRLALEEISGKDLNWFFNQWYYHAGHPILNISYSWDEDSKTQKIYITQKQANEAFKLPMKIDLYLNGKKQTFDYWMDKKADTLSYTLASKPDLVNVDADKVLLCQKTDNKTLEEFAFQYKNAPLYLDRLEALHAAIKSPKDKFAKQIILDATKDKFYGLRIEAVEALELDKNAIAILKKIIATDEKTLVKAAAITALANTKSKDNDAIYTEALKSQSYAIQAAALAAISKNDSKAALNIAKPLETESRGPLALAIANIYIANGNDANFNFVNRVFENGGIEEKFIMIQGYVTMLSKINDLKTVKQSLEMLYQFGVQYKNYGIDKYVVGLLESYQKIKKEQLNKANLMLKQNIQLQIDEAATYISKLGTSN